MQQTEEQAGDETVHRCRENPKGHGQNVEPSEKEVDGKYKVGNSGQVKETRAMTVSSPHVNKVKEHHSHTDKIIIENTLHARKERIV